MILVSDQSRHQSPAGQENTHVLPWSTIAGTPDLEGTIIKATDGITYLYEPWFVNQWKVLKPMAEAGTFAAGAYHYWLAEYSGTAQADYFCMVLEAAGIPSSGFLGCWLDIEDNLNNNATVTHDQIVDGANAFRERLRENLGFTVILGGYGRSTLAAHGVKAGELGLASNWWIPRYNDELNDAKLNAEAQLGLAPGSHVIWQYTCGKNGLCATYPVPAGYPRTVNGLSSSDVGVFNGTLEQFQIRVGWKGGNVEPPLSDAELRTLREKILPRAGYIAGGTEALRVATDPKHKPPAEFTGPYYDKALAAFKHPDAAPPPVPPGGDHTHTTGPAVPLP